MFNGDIAYWKGAIKWWTDKAEEYHLMGDAEGFNRCMSKSETYELFLQEAQGLITVVSGRKGFGLRASKKINLEPVVI